MSIKHPIIAITGSSGAGTTSVTHTFQHIFRREKLNAEIIGGDSFHRYDRAAMTAKGAAAWKPAERQRVVSPALRAYAAMTTNAARGAVRDVSQVE